MGELQLDFDFNDVTARAIECLEKLDPYLRHAATVSGMKFVEQAADSGT